MARGRNDGKDLEEVVRGALRSHRFLKRSFFQRFYDSTSAGGAAVPGQAGDYLWLLLRCAVLLECKSTEEGSPILQLVRGSESSRNQVPRHRLWHAAGHPSIYVWGDLQTRMIKIYSGKSVVDALAYNDKDKLITLCSGFMDKADALFDQVSKILGEQT